MARGREIQLKSLLYARYDYLARTRLWPDSTDRRAVLCIGETDFPFFRPNFRTFEGIFLLVFALHFSLPTRENSFPHRFQFSRFIQSSCAIVVRFLRHLLYSRRRQKYRDRLLFHVFSSRVAGQQVFKLTVSFLEFTRDKRVNASRGRTFGIKKKGEREDAGLRDFVGRYSYVIGIGKRNSILSFFLSLLGAPSPGFKIQLDEKRG